MCWLLQPVAVHGVEKIGAQIEVAYGGVARPFITSPVENVLLHIHGHGGGGGCGVDTIIRRSRQRTTRWF